MAIISASKLLNGIAILLGHTERGGRLILEVAGLNLAEVDPIRDTRALAAPGRLAAILAETPPDPGFAADLSQIRRQDRESAAGG